MKSLTRSISASRALTFSAEQSRPTAISASGTILVPAMPAALQSVSSMTSTPMSARIAAMDGSPMPSMQRMRLNPAASLRRITVSTRRRGSRRSSKALGTTTTSADGSTEKSSGRGSLTTSIPSRTHGSDGIPEEAVLRRPDSSGTSAPRMESVLPPSVTLIQASSPSETMTQGVDSFGPPFSLEYSQSLALWDLASTSNMSLRHTTPY